MVISPIEHLLLDVETQVAAQARLVRTYDELAGRCGDDGLAHLTEIMRSDAERGRCLLARFAGSLRNSILWLRRPDPLPLIHVSDAGRAKVLLLLDELLSLNRERMSGLRGLSQQAERLYDGLAGQLLEAAVTDGRKHERLLEYARRQVGMAERVEPDPPQSEGEDRLRRLLEEVRLEGVLAEALL